MFARILSGEDMRQAVLRLGPIAIGVLCAPASCAPRRLIGFKLRICGARTGRLQRGLPGARRPIGSSRLAWRLLSLSDKDPLWIFRAFNCSD